MRSDANKLTSDPLFLAPGGATYGRSTASAYELQPGSPELGSGVLISNNSGLDFFGNAVSSTAAPNRGAYNGSGIAQTQKYGAYWTFDQGSGTYASDATNDGNNGTLQAGASWTIGKVGPYAVSLNGASNNYVDVPTTAIDSSQSYSVAAWVNLNSLAGNQTFASIDGNSISPFYLQLSGGKFTLTERSSDSTSASYTQVAANSSAATGTWYHVVGTYDSSAQTIALWVNGVSQGTASFTTPWTAAAYTMIGHGIWGGSGVDWTNGAIDDVHFYNRVLTSTEISELAAA